MAKSKNKSYYEVEHLPMDAIGEVKQFPIGLFDEAHSFYKSCKGHGKVTLRKVEVIMEG